MTQGGEGFREACMIGRSVFDTLFNISAAGFKIVPSTVKLSFS